MPASEPARLALAVVVSLVLAVAAVSDIRRRRIPNAAVLALIGLFVVWAALDRGAGLVSSLEAAGIALAGSVGLYALGLVAAGDSKLFTAAALYAGTGHLPFLALATALIGGVIALGMLVARPRRGLVMMQMRGKGDWGGGVPYGVPIAVACAIVVWAPLLGYLPRL